VDAVLDDDAMSGVLAKLKAAVGMSSPEPEPEPELVQQTLLGKWGQQMDEATTMTWSQRVTGFVVCISSGIVLSMLSMFCLQLLAMKAFAVTYSLGAIVSILSTGFLVGFGKQMQWMTKEGRLTATLIYIFSIFLTLFVAFWTGKAGPSLLCVIVQFLALCWYCVTWIPGGQTFVKSWFMRVTEDG